MQGKIALVTGGMGGIGTAIAQCLAKQGAKVVVTYNKGGDHTVAEAWKQEQASLGFQFSTVYADIADNDSSLQMIMEVERSLGKIDILINNAGITEDVTLLKMSPTQWHRVINTNLNGMYYTTRHALSKMIESRYGRIINISSVNGQKGQFGQTNYCASKAGIYGFTKALAYEVAKKGITVNAISPGYVKTAMTNKVSPEILKGIVDQIPLGRLAEPEEIAHVVSFLAFDHARYITGANIAVNGGQYMQ